MAKVTQLPLTCFSSVTCLHHWTWTISTFIILPSTAALFLIITTYFYCTSYTLEFFWAQATLSFWSHPASCSPNTPHFFMDDAVIFYGQFPTCNITHSWLFCPEYFPTPLLTRKVLFILQLQLKFQLRQLVALPSVPSALFWESQTSYFFKKVPYWLLHHQYLAPYPVHRCISGIWWDKKYLNAPTNENQKFKIPKYIMLHFFILKSNPFCCLFKCFFSFCMLIKVHIYKLCCLIPG